MPHTHIHLHMHIHTCTHPRTRSRSHAHTHTHYTHTHTHTHTYTYTYTHTYTRAHTHATKSLLHMGPPTVPASSALRGGGMVTAPWPLTPMRVPTIHSSSTATARAPSACSAARGMITRAAFGVRFEGTRVGYVKGVTLHAGRSSDPETGWTTCSTGSWD